MCTYSRYLCQKLYTFCLKETYLNIFNICICLNFLFYIDPTVFWKYGLQFEYTVMGESNLWYQHPTSPVHNGTLGFCKCFVWDWHIRTYIIKFTKRTLFASDDSDYDVFVLTGFTWIILLQWIWISESPIYSYNKLKNNVH